MGRPKKIQDGADSQESTPTLVDVLGRMSASLEKLEERFDKVLEGRVSYREENVANPEIVPQTPQMQYPVPFEYQQLIKEMLNKEFEIEITPLSDSPAFQFSVIVPDKYSNISDEYRKLYKRDIRPKVVTYSEGTVGVRAFLEKVFSSFNPTIQALIVNERQP